MDLEGLDGLDGTGAESLRGTKGGIETPKDLCKKRKGSKFRGTEDVTLMGEDLDKIADAVASASEDRWTMMEEQYKVVVEALQSGLQVL